MINAMCLYEVDPIKAQDLADYEYAAKFNLSVSMDVSPNERLVLYVDIDPTLKDSPIVKELLQTTLEVMATRPVKTEAAGGEYKPCYHGFHLHNPVSGTQGACTLDSHHTSCDSFGPDTEQSCVASSSKFKCTHIEQP